MKTSIRAKSAIFLLGAALALSITSVRADDEKPVKHRHHRMATTHSNGDSASTDHSTRVEGANTIPTRDDRNSKEVSGGAAGGASGPEYRVPTGSTLPKHYDRKAHTTNNDDPEYIIDKNDQRIQSHNSVEGALRQVPGVSVRGLR